MFCLSGLVTQEWKVKDTDIDHKYLTHFNVKRSTIKEGYEASHGSDTTHT